MKLLLELPTHKHPMNRGEPYKATTRSQRVQVCFTASIKGWPK